MTHTPPSRKRRGTPVLLVAAVALAPAACSSDGDASAERERLSSTTTSTAPVTTTTASADDGRAAALEVYRAFWDSYLAAADPMNPDHPGLAEHATGEQLRTVQSAFLAFRSAGHVIRGTYELAPEVVTFDGTTAVISDCYDDATGVFNAETGARQDVDDPRRHEVTARLERVDGAWKVAQVTHKGDGCEVG